MKINVPVTFSDIRTWARTVANVLNRVQDDPTVFSFTPTPEPTSPVDGMMYWDDVTGILRFRKGGVWVDLTP